MVRLVVVGLGALVLSLLALSPLWLALGTAAVVPVAVAVLHALAMLGVAQWALGDLREPLRLAVAHPADYVTMIRSMFGSVCLGVVVAALLGQLTLPTWWLAAMALPAVVLDAVDGPVARRTGTASAAGGRYDVEADSMFAMIISIGAAIIYGPWVLVLGGMRYAFVLAGAVVPKLRGKLAFRQSRRVIAAIQGVALAVSVSPLLPWLVNLVVLVAALALLVFSFARDIVTLVREPAQT